MVRKSFDSSTGSDSDDTKDGRVQGPTTEEMSNPPQLFLAMTKCPYPFLVTLPFLFMLAICLGFSRPSIIEEDVSKLWIPTDGRYHKDLEYAERVVATEDDMSTFMAMALSRHGNNLFTEDNLNAIVERMQRIETATVTHKGINYTWNDICRINGLSQESTYQMPCLRLSPMDLFEEARWYFTEEQRVAWFKEIRGKVIKPLLIRYGIALDKCVSDTHDNQTSTAACDHAYMLRNDPYYAVSQGYSANHAGSVTDFLQDLFSLPLHDPCRICIDENTAPHLQQLKDDYVVPAFTTLTQQLRRFLFALEERDDVRMDTLRYVEALIKGTASIATQVTSEDVEDFYMYYTLRSLYGEGALAYQEVYREVNDPLYRSILCGSDTLLCPPEDVTLEEAKETLLRHADNSFSSDVSFGAPFPFWGSADGTGHLFAGTFPVSGSGVNMSAPFDSLKIYLDLENRQGQDWRPFFYDGRREYGFVDPLGDDYLWETMVETNPVFSWFMAGEEAMTAHCGNGNLLGTNSSDSLIDMASTTMMQEYSQLLCTKHHQPFEVDDTRTRQHFARMWYDMVIESPFVLDIRQGESDPYSWTTGSGCGYDLGSSRFSYTGQSEDSILQNASTFLYNIDEGAEIGVIDTTPLIGDVYPPVGQYSFENPLQHVGLLQTVYITLVAQGIVERVKHKNRPGGPRNITEEDAREVLILFKASFESLWAEGWDDDSEEVQFICFFDDAGTPGTLGVFVNSVTKSSGLLTAASILVLVAFSAIFLARCDPVKSRVGITLIGVILVMLAFFASVGVGILMGIKVNLTTAWTLPFIILGLGVDNVYIILISLQKQGDYTEKGFFNGMKEVLVPITMTTLVNASMFLVMNINSMPAVYLTAQVAVFSIIFLYLAVILCFPAYTYFDMKRQNAGRHDLLFWKKAENVSEPQRDEKDYLEHLLYDRFYKPIIFGEPSIRIITHSLIWAVATLLLALGLYGISQSTVGLGLEDFLPTDHQGHIWASARSDILGSWVVTMNWPAINYTDSNVQMRMIQQFERVIDTPYIEEVDTRMLWIAELGLWTSRLCDYNLAPGDAKCGRDQVFEAGSSCAGTWKLNSYGLREKYSKESDDQCQPYDGGICVPASKLHPTDILELNISVTDDSASWCPVFEGWSQAKTEFCLRAWHGIVGGHGSLVLDPDLECGGEFCKDHMVKVPIPYSSGPTLTARDLVSHELTLEMMQQTRAVCDQDPSLHCWMSGPPFDYWSQYEGIQMNLVEIAGASIFIGFGISLVFFALKFSHDGHHRKWKVLSGSLVGATLIAGNCLFCLVSVIGLSVLAGVSLTAFSIMSFALTTAFAVEYCVHVIAKWLRSDLGTALERVEHTMSFLMLPTFLSFGSSAIGVLCLAMTDFEFNTRFFFRPLIITVFVTYFFGCWVLPCFLSILDFEFVKLGPKHKNVHSSVSHLSKLHGSETGEMEPSTDEDLLRSRSQSQSEIETTHPSDHGISCIANSLMETEATSLEFLQCYNISDCGSPEKQEDVTIAQDADDNSLLSEAPPPFYALAACHSLDNNSKETASLSSLYSNERSALYSVGSSQVTVEVDNTLRSILSKKAPARLLLPALYRPYREPYQEEERDAPSLVDALLAESVDATSFEDLSATSNAFDGIESSSQDEKDNKSSTSQSSLLNIDPTSLFAAVSSVSAAPVSPAVSPLPTVPTSSTLARRVTKDASPRKIHAVDTSPREILIIVGPASTGAIFREREDPPGFSEPPPLQQSCSTSPRKKRFSLEKPVGMIKTSGSQEIATISAFGSNEILNSSNDELLDGRYSGFDFEHILAVEEPSPQLTVLQPSDTPSPPRSIHSLLSGVSGEVFSPIFEDEDGDDTINF